MMKKKWIGLLIGASMSLGLMAGVTTPARAATTDEPDIEVSTSSEAKAKVDIDYDYVLEMSNVAKSKVKLDSEHCFWATGTWTNSAGKLPDITPYKETSRAKFCELKQPIKAAGITWHYVKVDGGLTGSECFNLAVPPHKKQPKAKAKAVLDVKSLSEVKLTYDWDVSATAHAEASKVCPSGAIISAEATAEASSTGRGKIKLSMKAKAYASANGSTVKVKTDLEQQLSIEVSAEAEAKALAKIELDCGSDVPTEQPPVLIDKTVVNDVVVNKTTEVCAEVDVPDGEATLTIRADYGSFTTANSFTVSGSAMKCATYKAPSEVPAGGNDTITYRISNEFGSDQTTTVFMIKNPTVPA